MRKRFAMDSSTWSASGWSTQASTSIRHLHWARRLQNQVRRPDLRLPHLTLERRAAHEFDKQRHAAQFTTIVLNSVIQYFPDLDYFMGVLDGAV